MRLVLTLRLVASSHFSFPNKYFRFPSRQGHAMLLSRLSDPHIERAECPRAKSFYAAVLSLGRHRNFRWRTCKVRTLLKSLDDLATTCFETSGDERRNCRVHWRSCAHLVARRV